jgi:hypothetical protein
MTTFWGIKILVFNTVAVEAVVRQSSLKFIHDQRARNESTTEPTLIQQQTIYYFYPYIPGRTVDGREVLQQALIENTSPTMAALDGYSTLY